MGLTRLGIRPAKGWTGHSATSASVRQAEAGSFTAMDERRQYPECLTDVEPDDSTCPFCDAVLKKQPLPKAPSMGGPNGPPSSPAPTAARRRAARA